ncbi:hypothetical protein CERSUDRAFT_111202 [Gelatoporia subvermispora B]|uniref:C3H1-type domain-containing protein n=1 Tax=Ceriporiopsis subvermispora (strain B) TaxID=914234 RepID=M2RP38_CERS8|nr:hypothetical protein CERSUDRAFT_111202 [Gelatoporia subvermispora B]
MATSAVGEVNQQLWDDTLTRLLDLSTLTVKRNAELEARVVELEMELSVWKQAHTSIMDAAERDKKAHNAQVATLHRQIATSGVLESQSPLILCVIDGDSNIFHPSLLSQGHQGGRQAAQDLTKGIAEYLSQEDVQVYGRLSFWVAIYFNKRGLLSVLLEENLCNTEQFEGFISGLSQASPRFSVVDVGMGKDGPDSKIKEYLQTYARFPQTLRVFVAGGPDSTYAPILAGLQNEDLLGKIVTVKGGYEPTEELRQLALPYMQTQNLFMTDNVIRVQRRPGPMPMPGVNNGGFTTNGGLMSPQSENQSTTPGSSRSGGKPIDPSKPLHKQSPPPCNEHYLMTCSKGAGCKYSHDWFLTPEQLETLARNAKKAPCNYLKNGLECPYADACCWGHVCPSGSRCFHLSKGKCWFKGEGMHPASSAQDS